MAIVRQRMLLAAAAAAIALGHAADARADTFAQAILVIDHFRLTHSSGTPFDNSNFTTTSAVNTGHAAAALDGRAIAAAGAVRSEAGAGPDVSQQLLGVHPEPLGENDFSPIGAEQLRGTFGYADQYMSGAMAPGGAGQTARTGAAAALGDDGQASGSAAIDGAGGFLFTLGVGGSLTIAFDGTPFAQAVAETEAGTANGASTRLSWALDIHNVDTGALLFAWRPDELNRYGAVGAGAGVGGMATYAPGTLKFDVQTPMLDSGVQYRMTISQGAVASAFQNSVPLPEPGTLALLSLGMLGLAVLGGHRRAP